MVAGEAVLAIGRAIAVALVPVAGTAGAHVARGTVVVREVEVAWIGEVYLQEDA